MSTYICFTGGRDYDDTDTVSDLMWYLTHKYGAFYVVHGMAPGADTLVAHAAHLLGLDQKPFRAHWETQGKQAGIQRNAAMVKYMREHINNGDECFLVAFPGGKGTQNMIDQTHTAGIRWYNADAMLTLLSSDYECRQATPVRRRKRSAGALA